MLNDLDIAAICHAGYADQADGYWTRLWPHDCGTAFLKRVNNEFDVVVWRGSITLDDWLADLNTVPVSDPVLGPLHPGFRQAVIDLQDDINAAIGRPVIITGHSLGAAHALIHAGFLTAKKISVQKVTTFGPPMPGAVQLAHYVGALPGLDYRNRADPVTTVPPFSPYVHPRPLAPVDVEPPFLSGILADHHMGLYHTAMQARFQPTVFSPK